MRGDGVVDAGGDEIPRDVDADDLAERQPALRDCAVGTVQRHEIYVTGTYDRSALQVSYVQLPAQAIALGLPSREEINAQADMNVWGNWQVFVAAQRDLQGNQFLNTEYGVGYEDDCLAVSLAYRRKYTQDAILGLPPSTSVVLRFNLKTGDSPVQPFSLFRANRIVASKPLGILSALPPLEAWLLLAVVIGACAVLLLRTGPKLRLVVCALTLAVLALGPLRPAVYFTGTVLFLFSIGVCYAMFTAVALEFLGSSGKSGSSRYAIINSIGNLPVAYMAFLDGRSYAHWGPRAMPAADAVLGTIGATLLLAHFVISRRRKMLRVLRQENA